MAIETLTILIKTLNYHIKDLTEVSEVLLQCHKQQEAKTGIFPTIKEKETMEDLSLLNTQEQMIEEALIITTITRIMIIGTIIETKETTGIIETMVISTAIIATMGTMGTMQETVI